MDNSTQSPPNQKSEPAKTWAYKSLLEVSPASLQVGQVISAAEVRSKISRMRACCRLHSNAIRVVQVPPRSGTEAWQSMQAAAQPQQDADGAWRMPGDWTEVADCKFVFEIKAYMPNVAGAQLVRFALTEHKLAQWQREERARYAELQAERDRAEQERKAQWLQDWNAMDI